MAEQHILVADDSEPIREVIASFLETRGYRIDQAADGQMALDLYRARQHDLVVTDLQMPRLEGLPLLQLIKTINPDAQVIILTGHATLETALQALRLGAYDYLLKPIEDLESFHRLVDRALVHGHLLQENKRLVEELRQVNTRLEAQVTERTRDLQAANESLLSLDKLKNDFVSVVSHELRTPLSVIMLEAQLLNQAAVSLSPQKLKQTYSALITNAGRLRAQIENLLDFSLLERGELELHLQPCSVNQAIREVIDLYQARADEKKLHLIFDRQPSSVLTVTADMPRLRSALIQLVDNALKFTPENGTITIGAHGPTTIPGSEVRAVAIVVKDTGIGVPLDRQPVLFKLFSQADMSLTRRYGGMGIGLALAIRIVAAHGGSITFKSAPNEGSIFAMWIPSGNAP
jgi:signal transduction histidine kinase